MTPIHPMTSWTLASSCRRKGRLATEFQPAYYRNDHRRKSVEYLIEKNFFILCANQSSSSLPYSCSPPPTSSHPLLSKGKLSHEESRKSGMSHWGRNKPLPCVLKPFHALRINTAPAASGRTDYPCHRTVTHIQWPKFCPV